MEHNVSQVAVQGGLISAKDMMRRVHRSTCAGEIVEFGIMGLSGLLDTALTCRIELSDG